jgi:hypothetical protein
MVLPSDTLLAASQRKWKIKDGRPVLEPYKEGEKISWLAIVASKVMELAADGNAWAVDHIATRMDGKPKEQVDITHNSSLKIRYESYEEARAALLEEGIDIKRIPMLTDMRRREEREQN